MYHPFKYQCWTLLLVPNWYRREKLLVPIIILVKTRHQVVTGYRCLFNTETVVQWNCPLGIWIRIKPIFRYWLNTHTTACQVMHNSSKRTRQHFIHFFRALQLPPEAWLRMSLHNGSMTWLTIRPNGRVSLRMLGDCGYMDKDKLTTG